MSNLDIADSDLAHLFPTFRVKVVATLAQATHETAGKYHGLKDVRLFEGYRSQARQTWLYEQGRTHPGSIVTNVRTPIKHGYGLAADVVGYTMSGEPSWDWPDAFWEQLGHAARTQGLEWGGDWKGNLNDTPHIQMSDDYKAQHFTEVKAYLHSLGLTTP